MNNNFQHRERQAIWLQEEKISLLKGWTTISNLKIYKINIIMYLKWLSCEGLAIELKCVIFWPFGRKPKAASKVFSLVINKSIRIYGNCDQRNSDKLKWGEMWITSAQQDECQIYWTQQGQCVRHHLLSWERQANRSRSLKTNSWENIINILIFESFILFWDSVY